MNLSVLKSTLRLRPRFPGLSFKLRSSLLNDLKTSFLSGADAFDASLVNKGPNIFFKNFFKIKIENYYSIPVFTTLLPGKNFPINGNLCNSFLSTDIINNK